MFSELIRYVERRDQLDFSELTQRQIEKNIIPLLEPIERFVGASDDAEFLKLFNVILGSGGVRQYYFALSKIINDAIPEFRLDGYDQWRSDLSKEEHARADQDSKWVQDTVHKIVVTNLEKAYGPYFFDKGISNKEIQVSAHKKRLDDTDENRGPPERYLDFIDLKKIVEQRDNWELFEQALSIPLASQKKSLAKYVLWFEEVNRIRRVAAHPYGRAYKESDLEILQQVKKHLSKFV